MGWMSHRKWKETRDGEVPSQKELSSYFEELLVVKFLVKRNLVPQMRKFSPTLKETKQQPSMLPGPPVPGCCLVSLHSLCYILCTRSVQQLLCLWALPFLSSRVAKQQLKRKRKLMGMGKSTALDERSRRFSRIGNAVVA